MLSIAHIPQLIRNTIVHSSLFKGNEVDWVRLPKFIAHKKHPQKKITKEFVNRGLALVSGRQIFIPYHTVSLVLSFMFASGEFYLSMLSLKLIYGTFRN